MTTFTIFVGRASGLVGRTAPLALLRVLRYVSCPAPRHFVLLLPNVPNSQLPRRLVRLLVKKQISVARV